MLTRDLDLDHLDAAYDLRTRAFGYLPASSRTHWRQLMAKAVREGRVVAVYDGDRLAAMARINQFRQWWLGRDLPMAGVAGVVVAPEDRGRGVGRLLMTEALARAVDLGYALSALYPATTGLYRSLGWEHAGAQYQFSMPTEALRRLSGELVSEPVKLRRAGADDAAEVAATIRAVHAGSRDCGPLDWGEDLWRLWLDDDGLFAYLADDGFLAYRWERSNGLEVETAVAASETTVRALWATVGSGSSTAARVRACVSPHDPVRWLTREAVAEPDTENIWMLRLLDAPAAVAGRGFPPGVQAEAVLAVDDPQVASNAGTWRLTVAGGSGRLDRAAPERSGAVRLDARGLAALYAGTPLATLRRAGLVTGGDPDTDALLDAAFAARPYMLDYF